MKNITDILENIINNEKIVYLYNGKKTSVDNIAHLKNSAILNFHNFDISNFKNLYNSHSEVIDEYLKYFLPDDKTKNICNWIVSDADWTPPRILKEMIKGAILFSPEDVVTQISDWQQKKHVTFQCKHYVSGISIDSSMNIANGLHICPVNESTFPAHLFENNPMIQHSSQFEKLKFSSGVGVVITFDMKGYFHPIKSAYKKNKNTFAFEFDSINNSKFEEINSFKSVSKFYSHILNPFSSIFLKSIALNCNIYTENVFSWIEKGDAKIFGKEIDHLFYYNHDNKVPLDPPATISIDDLQHSFNLFTKYYGFIQKVKDVKTKRKNQTVAQRFETATWKWMDSLRDVEHANSFVDMRIALEALFLENDNENISMRLALLIAKIHTHDTFERVEQYEKVRRFYALSSSLVHGGNIFFEDNLTELSSLLVEMQTLFKESAIDIIENQSSQDWRKTLLG